MISVIFTYTLLALLCIPAGMIGRAVDKQIRRRDRELRRQQAQADMAEISALYDLSKKEGLIND